MVKNYISLMLIFLLVSTIIYAQQSVFIDFGDPGAEWITSGNYNNMTGNTTVKGSNGIADLINDVGAKTGFTFAIVANFDNLNTGGTKNPTGDAANFDIDATKDSYYTSISHGNPNGKIYISGLDDSNYYSFEIFACRGVRENRETEFTITGNIEEIGFLNPGGITNVGGVTLLGNISNTLLINNVKPDSDGGISVRIKNGANNVSNWSYINALKMTETSDVLAIEEAILEENGVNVYPNPVGDKLNIDYMLYDDGIFSISIYDLTGRLVFNSENGENRVGIYSFKWNRSGNNGNKLTSGIYFLKLQTKNNTYSKKLILK